MIVIGLLGYPLLGTLIAFTSLPSLVASLPVRAALLVLSFALLNAFPGRAILNDRRYQIILAFWLMYFVRLVWDLMVVGIPVAGDFMFTFVFFCVIPSLALMHAPEADEYLLTRRLLRLGFFACVLAIVAANTDLAGARSTTAEAEGRLFLDTVNPITFGHVGVTTVLAALSMARYCKHAVDWVGVAAAVALGFSTIQWAASRGPLVSLLICLVLLALTNRHYRWLLFALAGIALWMFVGIPEESESLLTSRIVASAQSDNAEIRIIMQASAIQQFLDSPLVGSAIIERLFEDYPHNIIIEAAMAIGVLGLGLILVIMYLTIRAALRRFRVGELMLPLLVIQYLAAAQFSGSIAASTSFWMLVSFVIAPKYGRGLRPRAALAKVPLQC